MKTLFCCNSKIGALVPWKDGILFSIPKRLKIWTKSGKKMKTIHTTCPRRHVICSLTVWNPSPSKEIVVSGCSNGTIQFWKGEGYNIAYYVELKQSSAVEHVAVTNKWFISLDKGMHKIRFWNEEGIEQRQLDVSPNCDSFICWNNRLVVGETEGLIVIYDEKNNKVKEIPSTHQFTSNFFQTWNNYLVSLHRKRFYINEFFGEMKVWDTEFNLVRTLSSSGYGYEPKPLHSATECNRKLIVVCPDEEELSLAVWNQHYESKFKPRLKRNPNLKF